MCRENKEFLWEIGINRVGTWGCMWGNSTREVLLRLLYLRKNPNRAKIFLTSS